MLKNAEVEAEKLFATNYTKNIMLMLAS